MAVRKPRVTIDGALTVLGLGLVFGGGAVLSLPWACIVTGAVLLAGVFWRR